MAGFERLFSMGAFEGLRSLRLHAEQNPSVNLPDLVPLLREIDPELRNLDLDAALELHPAIVVDAPLNEVAKFYRQCIRSVVEVHSPPWIRYIPRGRLRLQDQLTRDERQCFRSAYLLDNPPLDEVVEWWDELCAWSRAEGDQTRLLRSRAAERLSLRQEEQRLRSLGIDMVPYWIAIDDNGAGYDIRSYDIGDVEPVSRVIEVKSSISSPLRFIVTRNEWEKALKFGSAYHFHIWDMTATPPRLYERTVDRVRAFIPVDQPPGKWTNAEILVGSS